MSEQYFASDPAAAHRPGTVHVILPDLHLELVRMLKAQFGVDDPKELGINLRNINALTELGRAQAGVDACLSVAPQAIAAERAGDLVTVLRNDGKTGPAYQGPEGRGAGKTIASFAKTPFAPEAYYPHRIWLVARLPRQGPTKSSRWVLPTGRARRKRSGNGSTTFCGGDAAGRG